MAPSLEEGLFFQGTIGAEMKEFKDSILHPRNEIIQEDISRIIRGELDKKENLKQTH